MSSNLPEFLDLREGKGSVIISPNLGKPVLLNLKEIHEKQEENSVVFKSLIISNRKESQDDVSLDFQSNVFVQPLLKDSGLFHERRGKRYPLQITKIEKIEKTKFKPPELVNQRDCEIWDMYNILLKLKAKLGKRTELHEVTFKIERNTVIELENILAESNRPVLLLDLIQHIPDLNKERVNYHSIALYNKLWEDFSFIHSSDAHIARRNDFVIEYLKQNARENGNNAFILSRDYDFEEGLQEDKFEELHLAKLNFNYTLRKLIEFCNLKVSSSELDFCILSGDLVDYVEIAYGNDQYIDNYYVFLDIILGLNRETPELANDDEYLNKNELMVPIFTLTGNHDYRLAHYDMVFSGTYKVFGFAEDEIAEYKDQKRFKPLRAIKSKLVNLNEYLVYINPSLNYMLKIGDKFNIIFMDTGHDSLKEFYELLKGGTGTKGMQDYQVDLFRSYVKQSQDKRLIAILHAPPISPKISTFKRIKLGKKVSLGRMDFYSKKMKQYMGTGRLDSVINLKYQSFKDHWASVLKLIIGEDLVAKRKIDIVLCGHTHTSVEYRLVETEEDQVFKRGVVFAPSYVRLPCDTETGDFSEEINNITDTNELKSWIEEKHPIIFQTQGLGPFAHRSKFVPPGFRYITVENYEVSKMITYSIHLKNKRTE